MIDYKSIRSVHLEISTRCNAACPLCPRNTAGYDEDLAYPVHSMTLEEAKRIFVPKFLRQLDKILINGNFGDFVTAQDNVKILQYFYICNPDLRVSISTNASTKSKIWTELAKFPNLEVGFDIDGLEDTHKLYRKNTDWNTVLTNAKTFIGAGGHAVWRMIRFDHNQHQIDACRQLSKELAFKRFDLLEDGRTDGPVYDRHGNYSYKIGNDPNFVDVEYPKDAKTWREWTLISERPENRIEFYKKADIKQSVSCYAKQNKEIYITATGEVYPCCWLGFYPKLEFQHPWQRDNMFLKDMALNNNALDVSIEQAIAWFNSVEESWNKKAYHEGRLFKCDEQCGH